MAISDELWMITVGLLFNYAVLYNRNKLLGGLVFAGLGLATMSYSTGNQTTVVGIIILLSSLIMIIVDWIKFSKSPYTN